MCLTTLFMALAGAAGTLLPSLRLFYRSAGRKFRVDSADGPDNYFTTLTIEGREVGAETPVTVEVTFLGGFINETEGTFNSESPAAGNVEVGNRIVAFYKWMDDMSGGVSANALMCAHGGLYRTMDGPKGTVVLGRGKGYAVTSNRKIERLDTQVRSLQQR